MLSSLIVAIGADISGFVSGVGQVMDMLGQIPDAVGGIAGGITGFFGNMVSGALGFAESLGTMYFRLQGFFGLVRVGTDVLFGQNAALEQAQVAFTTLIGSASRAQSFLQQLYNFAAKTPFLFPDLVTASQRLMAFGINVNKVIPDLTAMGDAISAFGGSATQLNVIINSIGKIEATGHVTQAALYEMERIGIPALKIIADGLGITTQQAQELVKKGLIPASEGTQLLFNGFEKLYGGAMARQALTFNGLMTTLKDNIRFAWMALTGPLFDQAKAGLLWLVEQTSNPAFLAFFQNLGKHVQTAMGTIGNVLNATVVPAFKGLMQILAIIIPIYLQFSSTIGGALLQAFKIVGSTIINTLLPALGNLVGAFASLIPPGINVRQLIQQVGAFLSGAIVQGAKLAADGIKFLADFINTNLVPGVKLLPGLFNQFITAITPIVNTVKQLANVFLQSLQPAISQFSKNLQDDLGAAFKYIVPQIMDLGRWFKQDLAPALAFAGAHALSLMETFNSKLLPSLLKIGGAIDKIAIIIIGGAIQAFKQLAPILLVVEGFLYDLYEKALKYIAPYIAQAASKVSEFANDIGSRLGPAITGVVNIIKFALAIIMALWQAAWPYLKDVFEGVWDAIVGVVKMAWSIISGIIKIGLDLLGGNWKQAWNDLLQMVGGFFDGLGTLVHGVVQELTGAINLMLAIIKGAFGWLFGFLGSIFSGIGSLFHWLWDHSLGWLIGLIGGWVHNVISWFQHLADQLVGHSIVPDMLNAIKNVFKGAIDWVVGLVKGFVTNIVGLFNNIKDNVGKAFDWLGTHTHQVWDNVRNTVGNAFSNLGKTVHDGANGIVTWVGQRWNDIQKNSQQIWTNVQSTIQNIFNNVMTIVTNIAKNIADRLGIKWSDIQNFTRTIFNDIKNFFQTAWNNIQTIIQNVSQLISDILHGKWGNIKGDITNIVSSIWVFIRNAWNNIQKTISDAMTNARSFITTALGNILGNFKSWGGNIISTITGAFSSAWNGAVGILNNAKNTILGILGNIAGAIGNALHTVTNIGGQVMGALHGLHIPGFASGITNFSGGLAVVGEQGPELAYFPRGTSIIPNFQTNSFLAGLTGGVNASQLASSSSMSGGYKTATIIIQLDSKTIAQATGQPLIDYIRLRTGLKI